MLILNYFFLIKIQRQSKTGIPVWKTKTQAQFRANPIPKSIFFLWFISAIFMFTASPVISSEQNQDAMTKQKPLSLAPGMLWGYNPTVYSQDWLRQAPLTGHTGSLLEFAHNPSIVSNVDTAGFSATENLWVNTHGSSQIWQKWWLHKNDITNPLLPGMTSIDLPLRFWQSFAAQTMLTSYGQGNGYRWHTPSPRDLLQKQHQKSFARDNAYGHYSVYFQYKKYIQGPYWMPQKTLDREPAMQWGAPEQSRGHKPSFSGDIDVLFRLWGTKPTRIFFENIYDHRQFLNKTAPLLSETQIDSQYTHEISQRQTLIWQTDLSQDSQTKQNLRFLLQRKVRAHAGIEWNHPDATLKRQDQLSFLAQYEHITPKDTELAIALGAVWQKEKFNSDQVYTSLEHEPYISPLTPQGERLGIYADGHWQKEMQFLSPNFSIRIKFRQEIIHTHEYYQNLTTSGQNQGSYYLRFYYGTPLTVDVFETVSPSEEFITTARPQLVWRKQSYLWGQPVQWHLEIGLSSQGLYTKKDWLYGHIVPVALAKTQIQLGPVWSIFTGLQHESLSATSQLSSFLNSERLSGSRYIWQDNGDNTFALAEQGSILRRNGAKYHSKNEKLRAPVMEEFSLGSLWQLSRAWSFIIQGTARLYRNLWTVRYSQQSGVHFTETPYELNPEQGIAYNQDASTLGQEIYKLQNQEKDAYYINLEMQLLRWHKQTWFLNFVLSVHYGEGSPPIGNGPFTNDIGVFNESSADPNNRLADRARTDYDRGYVANLSFGFNLWQNIKWTNFLRYRDGEPFGGYIIADGLNQGPQLLYYEKRADPPIGRPRYTYALTWDMRLSYEHIFNDWAMTIVLDIYNLWQSRTEIYEYVAHDQQFRDPVEALPGRSFALGLEIQF